MFLLVSLILMNFMMIIFLRVYLRYNLSQNYQNILKHSLKDFHNLLKVYYCLIFHNFLY